MKYSSKSVITAIISAVIAGVSFFLFYVLLEFDLVFSLLITLALFGGLFLVLSPRRYQIGTIDLTDMANSEELSELLNTGMKSLEYIRTSSNMVNNQTIKTHLQHIYSLGQKIFEQIGKDLSQIKHIRRFFSYYLDVSLKLIDKYNVLIQSNVMVQSDVGLNDESIKPVIEKLETSFGLIEEAFSKQLNKLIAKDIMDVDVEMKVLESVLKEEG